MQVHASIREGKSVPPHVARLCLHEMRRRAAVAEAFKRELKRVQKHRREEEPNREASIEDLLQNEVFGKHGMIMQFSLLLCESGACAMSLRM